MTETKAPTSERPVLAAIAKIMKEVGAVEKRGRNEFHGYDYATAADIAHALQKRMADAGLIIIPHQREMRLLANDSVMAIEFEFMVEHVSGDRLEQRPVFTGVASCLNKKGGFDDKAANKCLTAATKYFALNLFRIPTGDYHDADQDEDKPHASVANRNASIGPITMEQMDEIDALLKETNANKAAFFKFFDIVDLKDLPAFRYPEAMKMLEAKRRQASQQQVA